MSLAISVHALRGDACKIFSVVGFNITVPFQMREDTKVNVVLDRESKKSKK